MSVLGELFGVLSTTVMGNLLSSLATTILWGGTHHHQQQQQQHRHRPIPSSMGVTLPGGWRPYYGVMDDAAAPASAPVVPAVAPPVELLESPMTTTMYALPLALIALFVVVYVHRSQNKAASSWTLELDAWQWIALAVCVSFFALTVFIGLGIGRQRTRGWDDALAGGDYLNVYTAPAVLVATFLVFQLLYSQAFAHHHGRGRHQHGEPRRCPRQHHPYHY